MKDTGKKRTSTSDEATRGKAKGQSKAPEKKTGPTHEQIAERAYILWQQNGCIPEQEEKYWLQAEAELKREKSK